MKNILRLEEATLFVACAYLTTFIGFEWWWFWVLLLTPDIGMLGYIVNPKVGAVTYNLFHHKSVAIAIGVAGILLHEPVWQFTGLLLLGHSAMDRMLGYGLKYSDHFKHTHLGWMGQLSEGTKKH